MQVFDGYELPITVSIVMSGQYEDDLDNCDDVVYTGQGGNNLRGNKRQISDQVLELGNLGLKVTLSGYLRGKCVLFACKGDHIMSHY